MPIYTIPGYKYCCNFIRTNSRCKYWQHPFLGYSSWKCLEKVQYLFVFAILYKTNLSIDSRKLFYNAYILPQLDYCCVIWGNCSRSLQKIVKIQKSRQINPKQRLWYPFHISIFSVKMDEFHRKSNIPESYSNVFLFFF